MPKTQPLRPMMKGRHYTHNGTKVETEGGKAINHFGKPFKPHPASFSLTTKTSPKGFWFRDVRGYNR